MSLIRISESENWIVDYDTERGMYKVSYFENGHFVDQHRFDAYKKDCFKERIELEFTRNFIHEHGLEFELASAWNKKKRLLNDKPAKERRY